MSPGYDEVSLTLSVQGDGEANAADWPPVLEKSQAEPAVVKLLNCSVWFAALWAVSPT